MSSKSVTPRCDELDELRIFFLQPTSPPYLSLLRLAKELEEKVGILEKRLEDMKIVVEYRY